MGSVDGHDLAVPEHRRGRARADHAGYAELARHDGSVAGHATAVSHQGRSAADGGHPVRAGHRRHQHLAPEQPASLLGRLQDPDRARRRSPGRGQPPDQHPGGACSRLVGSVEGGDRAGLDEVRGAPGHGPLDVLGRTIVALDGQSELGQRQYLLIGKHPPAPVGGGQRHLSVGAVGPADDLQGLVPDPHALDLRALLDHLVRVRLDHAGHHDLALAEGRFDDDAVGRVGGRVGGEHHPGALGGHHLLDDDRELGLAFDPLDGTVGDDPLPVGGGPAVDEPPEELLVPGHVGVGRVHAGERGVRGVLTRPRGPHRHPDAVTELVVAVEHGPSELGRDVHLVDECLGALGHVGEAGRVVSVQAAEQFPERGTDTALFERSQIGLAGDDEPGGHRKARARHLPQVGTLAPDERGVGTPELPEPLDRLHRRFPPWSECRPDPRPVSRVPDRYPSRPRGTDYCWRARRTTASAAP